ncbi:hypothetical protein ACWCOT_18085 [Nonomuraea bangladeshensis]|uniref:hypothetical protein n=1 Tax=Nonomuraea bangladeshensis TaxID=404385 RepID=UPI003C2B52CE
MAKPEHGPQGSAIDEGSMAEELTLVEVARQLARQALESEHQAAELRVRAAEIF